MAALHAKVFASNALLCASRSAQSESASLRQQGMFIIGGSSTSKPPGTSLQLIDES
jgi:hypothetical protein